MTGTLLVATVGAVGVLHTLVPDHWAPIVVLGRQRRWSVGKTARIAAIAGIGHVASTLALGVVIWLAGASLAARFGHAVSVTAAVALVVFGLWIAYGGWRELRTSPSEGRAHDPVAGRTALLLILGSSPMIEGLPAFLAASTRGAALLGIMAAVFAAATIATYVATCATGVAGLQRVALGPFERYGEVLSGVLVAAVGVYALLTA